MKRYLIFFLFFILTGCLSPRSKNLPLYEHADIKLYLHDSLDEKLFDSPFIDLTVTSPPYNLGINYLSTSDNKSHAEYLAFSRKYFKNLYLWTKPRGRFVLNVPMETYKVKPDGSRVHISFYADLLKIAQEEKWLYRHTIIWKKPNYYPLDLDRNALNPSVRIPFELLVVFYKEEWTRTEGLEKSDISPADFDLWTRDFWTLDGSKIKGRKGVNHPAPFPEEIPRRLIKLFSLKDDLIFDPFSGSATTSLEAHRLGRRSIGIEIDPDFMARSIKRLKEDLNIVE